MIAQRESAQALIARCRAAGKTIVAGGPLFTSEHAQFPERGPFRAERGGGDAAGVPARLRAGGAQRRCMPRRSFPTSTRRRCRCGNWRTCTRYASMCVQYSRGCPFDCEFCDVTAKFGHRPRVKSAAQVIAELDGLYRAGWRGQVFFVDDNLIGNKRALKTELLPALIAVAEAAARPAVLHRGVHQPGRRRGADAR
jgi:tRNA A37 methylthiotransferase MiaB